jgi:hypothetical protein
LLRPALDESFVHVIICQMYLNFIQVAFFTKRETSNWNGQFSMQIAGQTPLQIFNTVSAPGGSISTTFTGEFDVSVAPVPEPATIALLGGCLIALAAFKMRRLA